MPFTVSYKHRIFQTGLQTLSIYVAQSVKKDADQHDILSMMVSERGKQVRLYTYQGSILSTVPEAERSLSVFFKSSKAEV